jgi:chromosome transmission fidelity protein 4
MISFEVKQSGLLPLGKGVELRWVGFNELDVACFYDSRGVMHLLDRAFAAPGQARWTPVLDTASLAAARKDAEDDSAISRTQFWPLSMSSTQMFCIFVRGQGGQAFPDPSASGHPLIQEVDLKLPLLNTEQPSGELEEKYLRNTLLASSIRSATASLVVRPSDDASDLANPAQLIHEADKDLLQLIQLACKADKHARALDATRELHGSQMLDAALQIAAFFHLPSLADRMSSLREWIETRDERDERLERDGPAGVAIEDFSEAAERSHRSRDRIFAPSSQSPMPGGGSTTAQARRALMQDFGSSSAQRGSTPRRSQRGRGSGFGNSIMDASPAPSSIAMPPPPAVSSTRNVSSSLLSDSSNLMHRDEDEYRSVSPPAAGAKRKASDYAHEDVAQGLQKQRSTSNPFNKTSLSSTAGGGAARNPFARQPGSMVRDRSMHKSNSFFDRAEADLTEGSMAAAGGRGSTAAKKTKQTTLFGSAPPSGDGTTAPNGRRKEAASKVVATPAFGETQSEEDSQMTEDGQEESLRLTLDSAVEREARRERRGGLEETQAMSMEDDDEESQAVDAEEEDQPEEEQAASGRSSE